MLPSSVSTWPGCVNPKENKVIHMHVHKDKGISEILLIKLVKTRGTLRVLFVPTTIMMLVMALGMQNGVKLFSKLHFNKKCAPNIHD